MDRSHKRKHLQDQSVRNIVLAIGGIFVILFLLVRFGMDFLINFSLLVRHKTNTTDTTKDDLSYIAPPIINPMSEATKSATITISGYADDKQKIKLYINGKLTDKTDVKKDKGFVFNDVKLEKGNNEIKVKAVTESDKESGYSQILSIKYIDQPPSLDISSPQNDQTVSKGDSPIRVTGKTDPNVKVTVNDFWAIVKDDGSYSYNLTLHDGDNTIKVVATDDANNQTTKEIKIKAN